MTTRYVDGTDGNDAWDGLAAVWDGSHGPKLTLNGAEDTPVAAGDLVHVRPGVYREMLTCDVSGAVGNAIEYRGDYTGAIWGQRGVVRITGSDDDIVPSRTNCIRDNGVQINYRSFSGFLMDGTSSHPINATNAGIGWEIENCYLSLLVASGGSCVYVAGANQSTWTVRRCKFEMAPLVSGVNFVHAATLNNVGHLVELCLATGYGRGVRVDRVGGITVRNLNAIGCYMGVGVATALAAGQTVIVNNSILYRSGLGVYSISAGQLVEDYNDFCANSSDRIGVNIGPNSRSLPPHFDARWFFEMVAGGRMVTPFDLSQWSQLINVAGTNPPATDMRGTGAIGGVREWGVLEYDPTLLIRGGAHGRILYGMP